MVAHHFLGYQENNAAQKQQHGYIAMVVELKTVTQGHDAQNCRQGNHKVLKALVVHEVDPEQW